MLEQEDPLVRKFLSVGVLTIVMLVALRVAIGWHFFSQGLEHYHDRNWSSEGFLRQAKGPFADFYQSQIPDFHGWNELVSLPWEESAAEAASVRPDAKASKDKKKEKNDKAAPDKSKKPNTARATPAGRAHLQSLLNPQLAFLQETVESEPKSSEEPKSTEEPASTDEPKSTEEPKSESPAKTDSTTSEPAKTEEAKSDTVTPEPANSEPAKSEPAKSEPAKAAVAEQPKTEPTATEAVKSEPANAEPGKTEPVDTEPVETAPRPAASPPVEDLPNEGNPAPAPAPSPDTTKKTAPPALPTEGDPQAKADQVTAIADTEKAVQDASKAQEAAKNQADKEKEAFTNPTYGPFAARVAKDWSIRVGEISRHYKFDAEQNSKTNEAYARAKTHLLNYLALIEDDLRFYRREIGRLQMMESSKGATDIPFSLQRLTDKQREVLAKPNEWLSNVRQLENSFDAELISYATPEQRKSSGMPAQPENSLKKNDRILTYAMLICGGLLMIGLFTCTAAILCAVFLCLVMGSQLPWIAGTATIMFPYQLVEAVSLLMLATTAVGRWGGLDFFVHFLITAPFRSAKR